MIRSIIEALEHFSKETPDRLCIADDNSEYTYREMWQKVEIYAAALKKRNVQKEDKIVVECTQDARYLVICLACQRIGAVFVPVENKMTPEKTTQIVTDVNAKCFFTENIKTGLEQECSIASLEQETVERVEQKISYPTGDDIAEILFTTGATGKSKGIVLSNENNIAIAENIISGTEKERNCIELIFFPLSHSHGIRSCYANLLNGSASVIAKNIMNLKWIFSSMEKYKVTALDISPNAAHILLKLSKGALADYKTQITCVQVGTAFLDEELKEELIGIRPHSRLYNFYGSTESGRVCVLDFSRIRGKEGCIGKPAVNAKFMMTDEARNPIQTSREHPGLIAVSGKMNMVGYLNDKELTEKTKHGGYIYTNDVGYIDEDGYVYVLGRADDVINYKGIKIMPEEIEKQALRYEEIVDCACVAEDDKMCGQIPKLFVQVKDKNTFREVELMKFLSKIIEVSRMPQKIVVIDEIPRTSNGKILRRKLSE